MVHNVCGECACASVDVVEWDAIEESCPAEAADLSKVGDKYDIDEWSVAYDLVEEGADPEDVLEFSLLDPDAKQLNEIDIQQAAAEVKAAWKALQAAFAKATTVGESHFTLHIGYHASDDPRHSHFHMDERYFFWVAGADQGAPAGEKVSLFELYLRAVRLIQTNGLSPTPSGCPRCDALPGQHHQLGCTLEQCPYCGHQLLQCLMREGCAGLKDDTPWPPPLDDRLPWTGVWPGVAECREFGWYAKPAQDGWVPCRPDELGALPDLTRLFTEAVWNREQKRFVRPCCASGQCLPAE